MLFNNKEDIILIDYLEEAKKVFNTEIEALKIVEESLDENFLKILDCIVTCKGKVIITGMGKPGHIGRKIAATMASLGTSSFFLHPAEALHGDLGMVEKNDVVIAISYSGESEEITRMLPNIKTIGAKIIGISGNQNSTLINFSDYYQVFPNFKEASQLGLAPSSSTTVELVYGDALAIVASKIYGIDEFKFGMFHPAGSLGKRLFIKVKDIMASDENNATILESSSFKSAIIEMGKKGLGLITIKNSDNEIVGVVTDGDLRRQLEHGVDIYSLNIDEIMSKKPTIIDENVMAIEALQILKKKNISSAPVINSQNKIVGTIRLQDILNAGIVFND
jgi:arabinose-5-phosphate isomerase